VGHAQDEPAQHGAADDVHLKAVALFEVRNIPDDFLLLSFSGCGDVFRCFFVICENSGEAFSE
jgi:hypothetical protein